MCTIFGATVASDMFNSHGQAAFNACRWTLGSFIPKKPAWAGGRFVLMLCCAIIEKTQTTQMFLDCLRDGFVTLQLLPEDVAANWSALVRAETKRWQPRIGVA